MHEARNILHSVFGFSQFRPGQQQIVDALLAKRDVLAILPTGAGKSLCFQVPGLCRPGTTLVISPLISLMLDQVQSLRTKTVAAEYLSSTRSTLENQRVLSRFQHNQLKFLYLAPERLQSPAFLQALSQADVSQLIVDEAHCISTWGHQFRPEYREISQLRHLLQPGVPVGAFTATATPAVAADIAASLELVQPTIIRSSFARPNLSLFVYPCQSETAREIGVLRIVKKYAQQPGIIYAATRSSTEDVTNRVRHFCPQVRVAAYHGGVSAAERNRIQSAFIRNQIDVIVATTAFGMGVDKANIRYVVHFQLSASIENYYQEIGRAGRDGLPSSCYLFCVPHDGHIQIELIKKSGSHTQQQCALQKLKQMARFTTLQTCFHQAILQYFGEEASSCKNRCAVCLNEPNEHELLYGLSDHTEHERLLTLLDWRTATAEQKQMPEGAVATDKALAWAAFTGQFAALNGQKRQIPTEMV